MQEIDIAVIGSGIGGSLISALHSDKNLILFEKENNLGGCASTFSRYNHSFNAGATTFVGYEEGHIIKKLFDDIGFVPDIKKSDIAIRSMQKEKQLDRTSNFEEFLTQLDRVYPHENNRVFWSAIKELDERFWRVKNIYYNKYSLRAYLHSFLSLCSLIKEFKFSLLKSASSYIKEVLYDISDAYLAFIDAQLLITLQTNHKEIPLLSMALGLAYPFHTVYYPNGGMGDLIESLLKNVHVKKDEEVLSIKKEKSHFILHTSKNHYKANKVILNSSIYESAKLFEDKAIQRYYQSFSFSDQSAFVVYLHVRSEKELLHHYQIILDSIIPHAISNSFFISFSDESDDKLSQDGYSITISTHTKARFWEDLTKEQYKEKKAQTQEFILEEFRKKFPHVKVEKVFSATSKTFARYIKRSNCGGKAMSFKNLLQTPTCTTPFKNLYNVGDTIFAGQGWPGVALGVQVLHQELVE